VSDELIEAMTNAMWHAGSGTDDALPEWFVLHVYPDTLQEIARSLLPVIRAHLEPTSEMVEAVMDCGPIGCCNISSTEARDVIIAALAASPIGEIG